MFFLTKHFFGLVILLSTLLSSSVTGMVKPQVGEREGDYFFVNHALEQMKSRELTKAVVLSIIKNGKRHQNSNDSTREIYVNTKDRVAVVVVPEQNKIITAYRYSTPGQLDRWIEQKEKSLLATAPTATAYKKKYNSCDNR